MSTHGQRLHPAGVGGVRIRTTHYSRPTVFEPAVSGLPVAESRSGEAIQQPDIGPQIIDGGIHIVPGTIDLDLFASGIIPPRVVDSLPALPDAAYAEGSLVFLTTDGKLYRNYGDAWTAAVDGADILANSITAGQIAVGAVGADEIAAGAITTEKFAVTAKAPEVENADSSVQITPTGIVINNGAIVLRDDAGESVLSAAGFAGAWLDFLKTNVYNGTFSSGVGRTAPVPSMQEVVAAGDLPYWDVYRDAGATSGNSHVYHGSASDADSVMELRLAGTDLPVDAQVGIEQIVPLSAVIGRRGTGSTGVGVRVVTEPIAVTGTVYYVTTEVTPMGLTGVNTTPVALATATTGSSGLTTGAEAQVNISALPELTTHLRIRIYLTRIAVTLAGDAEVAIRNVSIVPGVPEVWIQGTGHDAAARIRTANGGATDAQLFLDPAVAYADTDKSVVVYGNLKLGGSSADVTLSRSAAGRITLSGSGAGLTIDDSSSSYSFLAFDWAGTRKALVDVGSGTTDALRILLDSTNTVVAYGQPGGYPSFMPRLRMARVQQTGLVSIPNGTNTDPSFSSTARNLGLSAGTTGITIPSTLEAAPFLCLIKVEAEWAASANGRRIVYVMDSAGNEWGRFSTPSNSSGAGSTNMRTQGFAMAVVPANTRFFIRLYQDSGGALNVGPFFMDVVVLGINATA